VFATFALFGTASLASTGSKDEWIVAFGLGLTVVLLPVLGIVAYRDLMDSFDGWRKAESARPSSPPGPPEAGLAGAAPPPPGD
jgi:hypothetical protein